MKKAIGIIVVVGVIAVGAVVWWLMSNLNSLVAKAIESEGSKVTETRVSVSGVDIKIREGRGSISNLAIASPDGYDAGNVFSLGNITVDIDLDSVREEVLVIDEIRISAPEVHAEFDEKGASNVDEIRKRVQSYSAGSGGGEGGAGSSGGEQKKLRIRSFVFEKGLIEVDGSALGVEKRSVDLPEFRLTNVGGANGAAPDQIAKEIASAVTKQVTSQIATSEAKKLIEDKLGGSLEDKAKGLLDKITN